MQDQAKQTNGRTVYAASSGSYSDYRVDCLFERREDADRYVALNMAEDVEEFTLYSSMPEIHIEYHASILTAATRWRAAGELNERSERTLEKPKHSTSEFRDGFFASGPDRERVIKSVRDRYAKWQAEQAGVA